MKPIYIIIVLIMSIYAMSCHVQKSIPSTRVNAESVDPRGNMILLGKSTKERLQQEPFAAWFTKNYAGYTIDTTTAELIKSRLRNKRFLIFMGTWCGDSRQEVPIIYKLLEYCEVPAANIQLINLNMYDSVYKQSPDHEEQGLNIHRVPDLLVFEKGKEIGRIVERPVESWEKDLLAIVNGEKYQPNYKIVAYLHRLFHVVPEKEIEKDIVKIADSLRSHISKNEGLLSFGNVLLATNETAKALIVHRLNTILYPKSANGFVALGDVYFRIKDRQMAKENYAKALALEPAHEKATLMLAQLMR